MRFGLSLLLFVAACGPARHAPLPRDTLVRLSEDEVKSLDPQTASDLASLRVAADQFEGLTRMNAVGAVEPGLADRWTVSDDGLRWRFRLRPALHFSDGYPIIAQSFVDVFARLRAAATASPNASLFTGVRTMTADGDTVAVSLAQPLPALPELFAHPALAALPLHLGPHWAERRPIAASGAYRLTDWRLHDRLLLARNPRWHGGAAPVPKVEWRPVDDRQAAYRLFRAGGADIVGDVPTTALTDLRRDQSAAVHVAPYRGVYFMAFNTRRPPFSDVRVRRALNLAIDRRLIAERLLAVGNPPAWGLVPPGLGLPPYRPDWTGWSDGRRLAAARALLRQAGYGPDHPLDFEIRFNNDVDHRRIAIALAALWRPLGVNARLLNSEATLHFAALRRGEFDLARSGWIGDISAPENFLGQHRSSAGPVNYSGYASPRFDTALTQALAEANPSRRAAAMRRAEAILTGDAPVLPLYFYVSRNLVAPRVRGWQDNAANLHPSRTLGIGTP